MKMLKKLRSYPNDLTTWDMQQLIVDGQMEAEDENGDE